ncbi:hypothetical protein D3C77_48960 [compost metagenome]
MSTIADMVRAKTDAYAAAVAVFKDRFPDREAQTIKFVFADGSELMFKIRYEVMGNE